MDIRKLQYFITIAEQGKLSSASSLLFVSQPALSEYLRDLEAEVGAPLFLRNKNGLTLTEAGRLYLDKAYEVIRIHDNLYNEIKDISSQYGGSIRIGMSTHRMNLILPLSMPKFRKKYPEITLHFENGLGPDKVTEALLHGSLDFGFFSPFQYVSGLQYETISTIRLVIATKKGSPIEQLASKKEGYNLPVIDLNEIRDFKYMRSPFNTAAYKFEYKIFKEYGLSPANAILSGTRGFYAHTLLPYLDDDIIMLTQSSHLLENNPNLIFFDFENSPQWPYCLIYHKNTYLNEAFKYLIQTVREALSE